MLGLGVDPSNCGIGEAIKNGVGATVLTGADKVGVNILEVVAS